MVKVTSLKDYQGFQRVWMPQDNDEQILFLVKRPTDLRELSWKFYQELMMLRIEWMISQWVEEGWESQQATHKRLTQALYHLNCHQEPPPLDPEDSLWEWAMGWPANLIEFNEIWMQKFNLENWEVQFPVTLPEPEPVQQAKLLKLHDTLYLEPFLAALTYGL